MQPSAPTPASPAPAVATRRGEESFLSRWRRRAVTLPTLYLLWGLVTLLFPFLLWVGLVVDVLRRQSVLTRSVVFFTVFLWFEAVAILLTFLVWPLAFHAPTFRRVNASLQVGWNTGLLRAGCVIFGMELEVHGLDALRAPGALLTLVRHVSTVDAVISVSLLSQVGRRFFRFVLKSDLLKDPCLDVVGNRLPNCFVQRDSDARDEEVARVVRLLTNMSVQECLVIYPEGTRFSPHRRAKLLERMENNDDGKLSLAHELKHTLPPMTRGTLALMGAMGDVDLVVVGHTGLEAAGSFKDFWRGGLVGARVKVWIERFPRSTIPNDEAGQKVLLSEAWRRMDQRIETSRKVISVDG